MKKWAQIFNLSMFTGFLGSLFSILVVRHSLEHLVWGFSDGFFVGFLMSGYALYFSRLYVASSIRRLSFMTKVVAQSLVYVFLFMAGRYISNVVTLRGPEITWDKTFFSALSYALVVALIANFVLEMSLLLGSEVTWSFIKGTYHSPIEEERIFLFVDLASSTTIAEKLGNKKFLKLLSYFFYDLGQSVIESGGEIYKYVGDEAIISWRKSDPDAALKALECYFKFLEIRDHSSEIYQAIFGLVPEFWGGLHGGVVIAGELGEAKKEIAYLGDVVNTSARILDVAKNQQKPLVVSEYIVKLLEQSPNQKRFSASVLGAPPLKGKFELLTLFEIKSYS